MSDTVKYPIEQHSFWASARKAIKTEFAKNGRPPKSIWVLRGTTALENILIGLGEPRKYYDIPVIVCSCLAMVVDVTPNEFLLDVTDPKSLEGASDLNVPPD